MLTQLKGNLTAVLLASLLAAATPWATAAQAQNDPGRRDETMGTQDHMRTGTNDRGDEVMVIERGPKKKQEMPNMGPIYVMPQVDQRGGRAPVVIPVPPPQSGQQPQTDTGAP